MCKRGNEMKLKKCKQVFIRHAENAVEIVKQKTNLSMKINKQCN